MGGCRERDCYKDKLVIRWHICPQHLLESLHGGCAICKHAIQELAGNESGLPDMNTNKLQQCSTRVIAGEKGGEGVNEPPRSLLDTVALFRPQESLTRPVNRHTSLVPAALSSFLSRRDTHTHANALTKAQTSPSEIFNRARQLALPPLSFIILYLLVCPAACSLGSSVVSAVFSFLPSFFFRSSVQSSQPGPRQPRGQDTAGYSSP